VKKLLPIIIFGIAIISPKLWLHSNFKRTKNPLFLQVNVEMPNFRYNSVALQSRVAEALGTSNLLNGHFFGQSSNRVSVFSAEWAEGQGDGGAFFVHTPQICWVGAGFRSVSMGEPPEWPISIAGRRIPFQCCILSHPNLRYPEIVLWAASVDGEWSDAVYVLPRDLSVGDEAIRDKIKKIGNKIKRRIISFQNLLANPPPTKASKQFLRISMPLTADWRSGLGDLEALVHKSILSREHQSRGLNN
jgi:hypothetical protein